MVPMFKASNIRCMSIININCFKHFYMFVVEATHDLQNYLFLDERFQELFYSSTGGCGNFFFIDRQFVGNFLFFDFSPFDKTLMRGT